jgi:hypothetical protein
MAIYGRQLKKIPKTMLPMNINQSSKNQQTLMKWEVKYYNILH